MEALEANFPRFKAQRFKNKAKFRVVDDVDKPSKVLLAMIPELGGMKHLPKLAVSQAIAPFLDVETNTLASFNATIAAIRKLANVAISL